MQMKILKDKGGEIPIVVLVIGVIAICVLAIVSFSVSIFSINNSYYGISEMQEVNKLIEKFHFYENVGIGSTQINDLMDVRSEGGANYIYVEEKKGPLGTGKALFSVKYFVP